MKIKKAFKIIKKDKLPTSKKAFKEWCEAQKTINSFIKGLTDEQIDDIIKITNKEERD